MGYGDAAVFGVQTRLREEVEESKLLERVMHGDVRIFGVVMTDGRMIRVAVQRKVSQ